MRLFGKCYACVFVALAYEWMNEWVAVSVRLAIDTVLPVLFGFNPKNIDEHWAYVLIIVNWWTFQAKIDKLMVRYAENPKWIDREIEREWGMGRGVMKKAMWTCEEGRRKSVNICQYNNAQIERISNVHTWFEWKMVTVVSWLCHYLLAAAASAAAAESIVNGNGQIKWRMNNETKKKAALAAPTASAAAQNRKTENKYK